MPSPTSHYFDTDPTGPARTRTLRVNLAGRDVEIASADGVFSGDRLDPGTSVLLREVPHPPTSGTFLDIGCGWGPIACTLGLLSPEADVIAVDVNRRSRELTATNAATLGCTRVQALAPEEVPEETRFDLIWSNPPIRIGKPALHALLLTWLPRLSPSADAYLVVSKNLGADSLQTWLTATLPDAFTVRRAATAKGFRILHVHRDSETETACS
ncbi:class I SAM-dependent methyltransferase [Dermatophilus congolensis]|uniref:class I SAM-dependent methyltransferase n=1 Tax=Dermatophilus congolensis TaxID=1863 RepID=UPI001AAE7791|nr:methyltransferase [Dermatophilus congolensis]MBO3129222.1 methyltransferase [Dermatophilus congolensis]MBO3132146.1 methyltransferase [Dermatophilus congolensis]MBO3133698.1 methyltransferase [Dermatophilus congolensis]MBO3135931.1 methyltransferase [Dermatophilus congolensis]MBO3138171.1 methyltransferase [Dermatophilus congolensis]